jgi:hypothetical protein
MQNLRELYGRCGKGVMKRKSNFPSLSTPDSSAKIPEPPHARRSIRSGQERRSSCMWETLTLVTHVQRYPQLSVKDKVAYQLSV